MREIVDAFGDLVLGAGCAGCGVAAFGLCSRCSGELRALLPRRVWRPLPGMPVTWAAGDYEGELRNVLLAAKDRGALGQLPLLGRLLARATASLLLDLDPLAPVVLVPVPSVRSRVLERGVDLTATLAAGVRRELGGIGVPIEMSRAVELARSPDDQVGLGRDARLANARSAFRLRRTVAGSIVVIDDVVTTGATLAAMAEAVHAGGGRLVGAAAVAQTAKRSAPLGTSGQVGGD